MGVTSSDEALEAIARGAGACPVLMAILESNAGASGALVLMRWDTELEALEEISATAKRLGATSGELLGYQVGPLLLQLPDQRWPGDLHPSRDQSSKECLRFAVR